MKPPNLKGQKISTAIARAIRKYTPEGTRYFVIMVHPESRGMLIFSDITADLGVPLLQCAIQRLQDPEYKPTKLKT